MKNIITITCFFIGVYSFSQIEQGESNVGRENNIDQETVTVEREYEPKVEAAEKIKQTPEIKLPKKPKKQVNYSFKDVEVASDFETTVIGAEQLPIQDQSLYKNYIKAGYGNNAKLNLDGYVQHEILDNQLVGGRIDYRATNPKIEGAVVNTNEAKLSTEAFYKNSMDNGKFQLGIGWDLHRLNYYGFSDLPTGATLESDGQEQIYNDFYVYGTYKNLNNSIFKSARVKGGFFSDKFSLSESVFDAYATFAHDEITELGFLNDAIFGAEADVNINFNNSSFSSSEGYNIVNLGVLPKLLLNSDILQLKMGANVQFLNEYNKGSFHVFPHIEAQVNAVPEFGFYGGLKGGIQPNRYQSFVPENPYLNRDLDLQTTINKMEVYAGMRGDLSDSFKFNASAHYQNLKNIPFYIKDSGSHEVYGSPNSFKVVYDNGNRNSVLGEINYVGVDKLNLGLNMLFQTYILDKLKESWEKPMIKASVNADYKFLNDKLILDAAMFYVGSRKGLVGGTKVKDVDAYVDLNAGATYLITERWSVFAKFNNLLDNNYQRFTDYQVQGVQLMGGLMFKF